MEEIIEKENIVNISEEKNINKDKLGLKEIKYFNLNMKLLKFCEFPSGNYVSINNKMIVIFNNNFKKVQSLDYKMDYLIYKKKFNNEDTSPDKNPHYDIDEEIEKNIKFNPFNNINNCESSFPFNKSINNNKDILYIKDDNNFGIIYNNDILLYSKNNKQFKLNEIIFDADKNLNYLCFYSNKIITCSDKIKIWKKEKYKYQCITTININELIYPISIEKDNFIFAGKSNIFILNLIHGKIIYKLEIENNYKEIIKINDYIIVESLDNKTLIISLKYNNIISEIKYSVLHICPIKNQDFFLAAGKNSDIRFFNINNGECFIGIETLFEELIDGIIVLNNGLILTYTKNGEIKIWTFDLNYIY